MRRGTNAVLGVTSNAVSGLANVLVQLLAAMLLPSEEFGKFSIVAVTVILVLGLSRVCIGQVDLLRGAGNEQNGPAAAGYLFAACTLVLGVGITTAALIAGAEVLGLVGLAVIASSVFALQDCVRYRSFTQGRSGVALTSDSVVLALVATALVAIPPEYLDAFVAVSVWTLATLAGAAVGAARLGYHPRALRSGLHWLGSNRDIVWTSAAEYVLQTGLPYLLNFVLLALGGLDTLAGYRLIQLIFALVANLAVGLNAVMIPHVVAKNRPRDALVTWATETGIVVCGSLATYGLIILLPQAVGVSIFGDTWIDMMPFLVVGAVHGAVNALSITSLSLVRLVGHAATSLWIRVGSTVATLVAAAAATLLGSPVAVAWAIAIPAWLAYLARSVIVYRTLRRLGRQGEALRPRSTSADSVTLGE